MVNLEHIRLLETRISRAIDYVKKINDENALLKERLGFYQTRIEELEVLVGKFKEEQNRIEDGILSALDRLNQFEDALESKLSANAAETKQNQSAAAEKETAPLQKKEQKTPVKILKQEIPETPVQKKILHEEPVLDEDEEDADEDLPDEDQEDESEEDDLEDEEAPDDQEENGELDIF